MAQHDQARWQDEDQQIQYWLGLLRDGTSAEKIEARSALADVFERRGMLEEATELLIANIEAGSGTRDPETYRRLARLYRQQGQEHLAMQAAAEAARLLGSSSSREQRSLAVNDLVIFEPNEDEQRAARLDVSIQQYIRAGYHIASQTPNGVQLVRPKTFSFLWATLWFLLCGVGVLVYIFYYMAKKDDVAYLTIDGAGNVQAQRSGSDPRMQVPSGRWSCPTCGHMNSSDRKSCKRCRASYASS